MSFYLNSLLCKMGGAAEPNRAMVKLANPCNSSTAGEERVRKLCLMVSSTGSGAQD